MTSLATNLNKMNSNRRTYIQIGLSLSLLVSLAASMVLPAFAQESMQASAGSLSQSAGLGMDQDSLLPPEVVPLDPATATQMSQRQAQSRAADMGSSGSVPGLANNNNGSPSAYPGGGQTAQDFRRDAFNSLYNQGSLNPNQNQTPGLQAQQPIGQYGAPPGLGQQQPGQLGQSGWMSANGAPQQQTLSGGVQTPPSQHGNSKFNAAKHVLGTATGFGGGMLVGAMMMRNSASSPTAALGMGLLGAGVLNYGLRNAFRF